MDPVFLLALRASFALLLASAARHKLRDPARFRDVLAAYQIVPVSLLAVTALAVPLLEVTLAALIALAVRLEFAAAAAAMLMLTYAGAISVNVRRGRTGIDCGCMGPAANVPLDARLVVRNLLLAAAATMLLVPAAHRALTALDAFVVVASTIALAGCWLATERLLALAPRAAALRRRVSP